MTNDAKEKPDDHSERATILAAGDDYEVTAEDEAWFEGLVGRVVVPMFAAPIVRDNIEDAIRDRLAFGFGLYQEALCEIFAARDPGR